MSTAPASAIRIHDIAAPLQAAVDRRLLAGAVVLVADRDQVLGQTAVGLADRAAGERMRPDHMFWIASMSKPITGTAAMLLVEEGRIALDDPVEKYLPEFVGQPQVIGSGEDLLVVGKPARPITVREVLSHTSGLPFGSRLERGRIDTLSLREAVLTYAMTPLATKPGTAYQYSNAGINIAGRIIEVVTGRRYEDFVDERLLRPLGMAETSFWPSTAQLPRIAKCYGPSEDQKDLKEVPLPQLSFPLDQRQRGPAPAGGYFSTATDMARFGRMILRGGELDGRRYLSEAAVREMTRKQTGALKNAYGLGWSVDEAGAGFGHGGAVKTDLWIAPGSGRVCIVLMHLAWYGNADADQILPAVRKLALA